VVVPENASSAKLRALKHFPVEVLTGGPTYDDAERTALQMAASKGLNYVSPYNHPQVVAGQATIGLEMLESPEPPDVVLVPIGGGGLISGIGAVLKHYRPGTRIVGVQAENSPAMAEAIRTGELVPIPVLPTQADGLAANIEAGSITFNLARHVVDEIVLISEEEMTLAIRETFAETHIAVEGSAAVGIAALLEGKVSELSGKRIGVVVTGRNIASDRLASILIET
jgi:threonine dehydratase